ARERSARRQRRQADERQHGHYHRCADAQDGLRQRRQRARAHPGFAREAGHHQRHAGAAENGAPRHPQHARRRRGLGRDRPLARIQPGRNQERAKPPGADGARAAGSGGAARSRREARSCRAHGPADAARKTRAAPEIDEDCNQRQGGLSMLNASRAAVLAAFLFALPLAAPAHERDAGQADDRLVDKFARFAGSRSNAESLVNGLRNDQLVKLTSAQQGSASFTPKTDRMGFGNVNIALTLAKATLAEQGITRPTPQQIEAVLNGGTITSRAGKEVKLTGILAQRASGLGWGKIAQANGFKLGELMRHHGDFR